MLSILFYYYNLIQIKIFIIDKKNQYVRLDCWFFTVLLTRTKRPVSARRCLHKQALGRLVSTTPGSRSVRGIVNCQIRCNRADLRRGSSPIINNNDRVFPSFLLSLVPNHDVNKMSCRGKTATPTARERELFR